MPMTKDEQSRIERIKGGTFTAFFAFHSDIAGYSQDFLETFKGLLVGINECAMKIIVIFPSFMKQLELNGEERSQIERNMIHFFRDQPDVMAPLFSDGAAISQPGSPLNQFLNQFRSQEMYDIVNEMAQLFDVSVSIKKKKVVGFADARVEIPERKLDRIFEAAETFREQMIDQLEKYKPHMWEKSKIQKYLKAFREPLDINLSGVNALSHLLKIIKPEGIIDGKKPTELGKYLSVAVIQANKDYMKFTTAAPIKKLSSRR